MKRALWMFAAFWMVLTASLGAPSVGSAATLLKGRVLGPDGLPVTASVLAYKKDASGEWQFTGSAETDANGDYSFNFLGTGKFYFECDAYEECDPRVNECAIKYLPLLYPNAAIYDFSKKTIVTLKDGDEKELATIRVKVRPFYFETVSNACTRAGADGSGKILRTVVNNTGGVRRLVFWGVTDSARRTDHTAYYNLMASYPFVKNQVKQLGPGVNFVTFNYKIVPKALKGKYEYWLVGGDENGMPLTPYLHGWICYGVSGQECASDSPVGTDTAKAGQGAAGVKTIPTKISEDGSVLETGPLTR